MAKTININNHINDIKENNKVIISVDVEIINDKDQPLFILTNRNFINNSIVREQNSLWKAPSYALIIDDNLEAKHKELNLYRAKQTSMKETYSIYFFV